MIYVKLHIRCDMFVLEFFQKKPSIIHSIELADYASFQSACSLLQILDVPRSDFDILRSHSIFNKEVEG